MVIKRPQVTTVEKKALILSLPYLGDVSLQVKLNYGNLSKTFWVVVSFNLLSKSKGNSLMFSDSNIAYLST